MADMLLHEYEEELSKLLTKEAGIIKKFNIPDILKLCKVTKTCPACGKKVDTDLSRTNVCCTACYSKINAYKYSNSRIHDANLLYAKRWLKSKADKRVFIDVYKQIATISPEEKAKLTTLVIHALTDITYIQRELQSYKDAHYPQETAIQVEPEKTLNWLKEIGVCPICGALLNESERHGVELSTREKLHCYKCSSKFSQFKSRHNFSDNTSAYLSYWISSFKNKEKYFEKLLPTIEKLAGAGDDDYRQRAKYALLCEKQQEHINAWQDIENMRLEMLKNCPNLQLPAPDK